MAAISLLDALHFLQSLPEPLALPELNSAGVWSMPGTGYVRLADFSQAVRQADEDTLRAGRSAGSNILRELLPGIGESESDLLAAWENEGAAAYPALRVALQRMYIAGLAANF
jgi:hypothetical protein